MFRNYFLIALRNLAKHRTFALINIGGLAMSLASCLFIFYYIYDEVTYDRFHINSERIYRITQTFITPDNTQNIRWTHQKLGPYLQRVYPQVENYVRFEDVQAKFGKSKISEKGIVKADPSVFHVFTYPLLVGNPANALEKPNTIVLSETLADKYFQGEALGEIIEIEGAPFEVTGIMRDVPANSDKWISAIAHGEFGGEEDPTLSFMHDTYIMLQSPGDAGFIRNELEKVSEIFQEPSLDVKLGLDMQALTDLHFFHGTEMDNPKGNKTNVYILGIVAAVLLLVSIVNFINLTTVRSLERAKEVGVRKVIGAQNTQLIRQFVGESLLSVVSAALLALVLIQALKVAFASVSGKTISLSNEKDLLILGVTLLLLIVLTVFSSFYPAWILSSYKPVTVLKGKTHHENSGELLRKIFTTGQFALSTGLLMFLTVILFQMNFMKTTELGFTKDEILVLRAPEDTLVSNNLNYYRTEFLKSNAVADVSVGGFASNLGTNEPFASPLLIKEGGQTRNLIVPNITVDRQYPAMLELKLREGKSFGEIEGDVSGLTLVNESFVKVAGWEDPIGRKVITYAGEGTVIGVIRDFHFQSLHNSIQPLAIMGMNAAKPDVRYFFLKTSASDVSEIRVLWKRFFPGYEMEYFFLDDFFNQQYQAEENLQILFLYFTILTIIVSASGLFGLTIYAVQSRTKEIGIRKVLGAKALSLASLLSKRFIKLVMAGTLGGVVIGFFVSSQWLNGFAYKVEMTAWIITLPAASILLLSLSIIAYKTHRCAMRNPMDSLRYE